MFQTDKTKILIIENQQTQFENIYDNSFDNYICFPNKGNFIDFIDNIRVIVNKEYGEKLRKIAFSFLLDYIDKNNIELIIMDHILGGAYHCLTGIDLADAINKSFIENEKGLIPILFLSKSEHNDPKRVESKEGKIGFIEYEKEYKNTLWVNKGLFGDEILKKEYFLKFVSPKIDELYQSTKEKSYIEKIQFILNGVISRNHEECVTYLNKIIRKEINHGDHPKIDELITNVSRHNLFETRTEITKYIKNII